jgi:hypothetical protein
VLVDSDRSRLPPVPVSSGRCRWASYHQKEGVSMDHPIITQIEQTGEPFADVRFTVEDESFIEVDDRCEECQMRKKTGGSDYCIVCLDA